MGEAPLADTAIAVPSRRRSHKCLPGDDPELGGDVAPAIVAEDSRAADNAGDPLVAVAGVGRKPPPRQKRSFELPAARSAAFAPARQPRRHHAAVRIGTPLAGARRALPPDARVARLFADAPESRVLRAKQRAGPLHQIYLISCLGLVTRMTATDAARSFSELLNRVANGEEIEVTRSGAAVAVISPPKSQLISADRFRQLIATAPTPDAEFAGDIRAARGLVEPPEDAWPS